MVIVEFIVRVYSHYPRSLPLSFVVVIWAAQSTRNTRAHKKRNRTHEKRQKGSIAFFCGGMGLCVGSACLMTILEMTINHRKGRPVCAGLQVGCAFGSEVIAG